MINVLSSCYTLINSVPIQNRLNSIPSPCLNHDPQVWSSHYSISHSPLWNCGSSILIHGHGQQGIVHIGPRGKSCSQQVCL